MRERLLDRGLCVLLALLPLAVFPAVERPFSTAKLFVLGAAALVALGRIPAHPRPSVTLKAIALGTAWMLTVIPSWWGSFGTGRALAGELAAGSLLVALLLRPPPEAALRWLAVSGAGVAGVALLQALGADPFGWFGLQGDHPGDRMTVYGTMGNPDFVAALLGATVWLAVEPLRSSRGWLAVVALHLFALVVTRSFGAAVTFGAGALLFLVSAPLSRRVRLAGVAVALLIAGSAVAVLASQRSLSSVVEGRGYLWRISAAHLLEAPLLGHGRGSFETYWLAWEADAWREGGDERERRFAGLQDHAHNDYLEWALELGLLGALLRMGVLAWTVVTSVRTRRFADAAASAALGALLVRGLFDFPFARPAELGVAMVLVAWCWRANKSAVPAGR